MRVAWPQPLPQLRSRRSSVQTPGRQSRVVRLQPQTRGALPRFASFPQAVGFLAEYRAVGPAFGSVLYSLLVALLSRRRIVSEVRAYGPEREDHKTKYDEGKKANKYFSIRVVNRLAV